MGIENIPEMKLVESIDNREYVDGNNFNGNFIVVKDSSSRHYLLGVDNCFSHEDIFRFNFRDLLVANGCGSITIDSFKPVGGGRLSIYLKKLSLGGYSTHYGDYDRQVVHPIVERWTRQHLPNHQLGFS